jgi:two-component sensor histidine kinase
MPLTVRDNGPVMRSDFDCHKTESLGLQWVGTLTERQEGTLELYRSKGTLFKLNFYQLKCKKRLKKWLTVKYS